MAIGVVLPVHIMYETRQTLGMNLLERYIENSWRNPTPYLRGIFRQPVPEIKPNPDDKVRAKGWPVGVEARRLMVDGPYIEYWKMYRTEKHYVEFRIGWKFVDGDETFWPTIQWRREKIK